MNRKPIEFNRIAARTAAGLSLVLASLFSISCTSTTGSGSVERGAVAGGLLGAIVGGVAGDDGGDIAAGAAIGAITGAVAGKIYENDMDKYRRHPARYGGESAQVEPLPPRQQYPPQQYPQQQQQQQYPPRTQPQPQPQPQPEPEPVYPWARKAEQRDHVISPHPPYNLINVEGFKRGELAIDPTTEKVFRVP